MTDSRPLFGDEGIARRPKRLLYTLLGELMLAGIDEPVPAGVYLDFLAGAGVAGPTARASLDRLVMTGYLSRARRGRSILYGLTTYGRGVMEEAAVRVAAPQPFSPAGSGWTLVAFIAPEAYRGARKQVRLALGWEGFAALRDGLWIAPGVVDVQEMLAPHREELAPDEVVAFHAEELPAFPVGRAVDTIWDLAGLRRAHEEFAAEWSDPGRAVAALDPVPKLAVLGADWTGLLRIDPRLPPHYLTDDWPAPRSLEVYRARRAEVLAAAQRDLRAAVRG
ncbi:PaaX family transcriptional regulator C-terminal domain-containing protein [Microbacterium sp. NPDC077184]|uniref:PaaX family transcriptional regulator C-terminal domain-containing protein n=1 Tax=Microbacterium sp. NPDC077184 TaxID=3154764 RepID=UPI0034262B02